MAAIWIGSAVLAAGILIPSIRASMRSDGGHGTHTAASHADEKPVLSTLPPVAVGSGSVQLEIEAARSGRTAVRAGAPATFRFRLRGVPEDSTPTLSVSATPDAGGRPRIADFERSSTIVLDTVAGQLFQLTDASNHDHQGSQGSGLGLSTVAGSAAEWATGFSPGGDPMVSSDGRWVVVPHREHPLVDVIDVLLRKVRAVTVPQTASAVAFAPKALEVWVGDTTGTVQGIDLPTGTVRKRFTAPFGVAAITPAADGNHVLLSASKDGDAIVVDATGAASAPRIRGGAVHHGAWSTALQHFVGLDSSGTLRSIGTDGSVRPLHAPGGTWDSATMAVAPSGERAVYVDRTRRQLRVVDLRAGTVLGQGDTGSQPADVVALDHFGIVRDAKATALTWIDVDNPDRSADLQLGVPEPPASLSVQPDSDEVLAPIAGEKKVLRAHIMMGRPMIMSSDNAGLSATVAAVSTAKLVRSADGAWQITTMIPDDGQYDLQLKTAAGPARFRVSVAGNTPRARIVTSPVTLQTRSGARVRVTVALQGSTPDVVHLVAYDAATMAQLQMNATWSGKSGSTNYYTATFAPRTVGEHQVFATASDDVPITQTLVARVRVSA